MLLEKGAYLPDKGCYKIISGAMFSWHIHIDGHVGITGLWGKDDVVSKQFIKAKQIECLAPVELERVPIEEIYDTIRKHEVMLYIVGHRLVKAKLKLLFDWLAERFGTKSDKGILINFPLTQSLIANVLCTTRVTITRGIRELRKEGFLKNDAWARKAYIIASGVTSKDISD